MPRLLYIILIILLLEGCKVQHLAHMEHQSYDVASRDEAGYIEDIVSPYRMQLQEEMNEVVGYCVVGLQKNVGESTMGNWVADAVLEYAERLENLDFDLGICNLGGLRISELPQGEVRKRQLYELMPFDNFLVVMQLDSTMISRLFHHMAGRGGWPISRGVTYQIEDGNAVNITINGNPLASDREYDVVLSDYLADGGDACFFLQDLPYRNLGVYYREALIGQAQWLTRQGKNIESKVEGRIRY